MPNPKKEYFVNPLQAQKTVKEICRKLGVPSKTLYWIKDRLKT